MWDAGVWLIVKAGVVNLTFVACNIEYHVMMWTGRM